MLMRVDFNLPLDKSTGAITNTNRIEAALPAIRYALDQGCKSLVLLSHMGRPKGNVTPSMSLRPVASELSKLLGEPVTCLEDCVGPASRTSMDGKGVYLFENLRFHAEEEGKGEVDGKKVKADSESVKSFRSSLSALGDVYVNDAFGTAHRAHSSVVSIDKSERVAGFLM